VNISPVAPNNAINSGVQKRRFALLLHAGYGERCRRAARDGNDGAKLTLDQQVADDVS